MFRTANPKDFKNSTFDASNFFFFVSDDLILRNVVDFIGLVNISLCRACSELFSTSISHAHVIVVAVVHVI